jgi:cyanate permease
MQGTGFALGPLVSGLTSDTARNYPMAFAAFLALSVRRYYLGDTF